MEGDRVNPNSHENEDASEQSEGEDNLHEDNLPNTAAEPLNRAEPPDPPEWSTSLVGRYLWFLSRSILVWLVLAWQWFTSTLFGVGIRTFGCHIRNRVPQNIPTRIWMIIFLLFAPALILNLTPLDVPDPSIHVTEMLGAVENPYPNVLMINDNVVQNNDHPANQPAHDGLGRNIQVIDEENMATEADDDDGIDDPFLHDPDGIANAICSNRYGDEEEIIFSSQVCPYLNDTDEINAYLDDHLSTTDESGSTSDNDAETATLETDVDLIPHDNQIDNGDDDARDENDFSFETRNGAIDEDPSSYHEHLTNRENTSINDAIAVESLVSRVAHQTSNENDPFDNDERRSIIVNVTDDASKIEIDLLTDDGGRISTMEPSLSLRLSTDSSSGQSSPSETKNNVPVDVEEQEVLTSDDAQAISFQSNERTTASEPSPEVPNDDERITDPIADLAISRVSVDSNLDQRENLERAVGNEVLLNEADENAMATENNNPPTSFSRPSQSSEHVLNTAQNSDQSIARNSIVEQGASRTLSSGPTIRQSSETEQKVDDGNAAADRSTNANLPKQPIPADDLDNESPNQMIG